MAINFLDGINLVGTTNSTLTATTSSLYLLNLTRTTTSLTTAGSVGIGTTTPSHALEVKGDSAIASINGTTTSGKPMLFIGETNQYGVGFRWDSALSLDIVDFDLTTPTSTSGTKIGHFKIREEEFYWKGYVGIGTTNPSHPLSVISSYPQIKIQQNGASPYFTFGSGTGFAVFDGVGTSNALLDIRDDGTSRMRIDTAGNVGIGTTAPIAYTNYKTLTIDGSSGAVLRLDRASNDNQFEIAVSGAFTYLKNINSKDLWFGTNNTERMRIKSSGNVGIGTTSPSQKLEVNGKAKITTSLSVGSIGPSATTGRIDASNDVVAYSTSDIRLKDNIKKIDKALNKVNSIQGIEFDWVEKEEVHGNSGHDIGVIAQEIEKVLPDVVTTRDNGYKAVKYEKIVPLLIEAIKDLSKQVDGLKRLI